MKDVIKSTTTLWVQDDFADDFHLFPACTSTLQCVVQALFEFMDAPKTYKVLYVKFFRGGHTS